MTDSILAFNAKVSAADTVETIYTAPTLGAGVKIKSFSATNNTPASVSYKAYIYNSAGVPVSAIIPLKIVVRDRFDSGTAAVGQVIPPGGTLRVECSEADSINFYVTGLEQ